MEIPFLLLVDGVLLLLFEGATVDGGVFFNTVAILATVFTARELTVSTVLLSPLPDGVLETGTAFNLALAGVRLVAVVFNGVEPLEVLFPEVGIDLAVTPVLELVKVLVLLRVAITWLVSGVDDLWLDDFGLTLCVIG